MPERGVDDAPEDESANGPALAPSAWRVWTYRVRLRTYLLWDSVACRWRRWRMGMAKGSRRALYTRLYEAGFRPWGLK